MRPFKTRLFLTVFGLLTGLSTSAQLVTNHWALAMPSFSRPPVAAATNDPVFGSRLFRLTDAAAEGLPGACPHYAKRQAWNLDESRLLLTTGQGEFRLHDGLTYQFERVVPGISGDDVFWSPAATNVVLYNPQNRLIAHDVLTRQEVVVCAFTNFHFADACGEGNLSDDGRYYAVYGRDYDEATGTVIPRAIAVWDLVAQTEVSRLSLPGDLTDFDWVSISPLGNYVVIDYATELTGPFQGVEVFDRHLTNRVWQKPLGAGHSDLGVDANGDEFLVVGIYDADSNTTILRKYRLRDGQETTLLTMDWSFYLHVSCRNEKRRDWCFVSTYDGEGRLADDATSWLPFEDEIFAVRLDGSQQVQRLAHHRSQRFSLLTPDSDTSVYWAEPHATVSRKGDRLLFGSNWRQQIGDVTNVNAYVVDFRQLIAPALTSTRSDGRLAVSWQATEVDYRLESTPTLSPAEWTHAPEPAVAQADHFVVTVEFRGPSRFFRLRRP